MQTDGKKEAGEKREAEASEQKTETSEADAKDEKQTRDVLSEIDIKFEKYEERFFK